MMIMQHINLMTHKDDNYSKVGQTGGTKSKEQNVFRALDMEHEQ